MSKTLIKQIFLQDSYWAINKSVAHIYGLDVALFLSFLIDKHDKCVNDEQYFYATKKDAEYQTGLTRYQQDAAVKVLVDNGLLYARAIGLPPTMHYCIRYEQIAAFFENAKNLLIEKRKEMEKKEEEKKQKKDALISKKITNCSETDLQNNITNNPLLRNQVSKKKKESVVTDTPPLQTFENSDFSSSEKPNNCENETSALKEKSTDKKPNSGGGGENVSNSVGEVGKPAKPKKAVREWFKLSSLTDEQKGKIRELARSFDSPGDFGESLKQWLEYKESGQVNFKYQKINPYKDFETMLKQVSIEAKKCQGQSQAFKLAVEYSIENLYLGLFPEKFITQTQPVKNGNYNKQQQGSVQPTIIFKTGC